jgi:hypothetical protein
MIEILLKNPKNASTGLSMNGISPVISTAPPFVLGFRSRLSFQILPTLALRKLLNAIANFTTDNRADDNSIRRGERGHAGIQLGILPRGFFSRIKIKRPDPDS